MILEGICSTRNPDGSVNLAPMGPVVDEQISSLLFRPFQTSTTYQNLERERCGVFHVIDDVLLIAQLVTHSPLEIPPTFPALKVPCQVLRDACRWYEFEVLSIDNRQLRTEIQTRIVHVGRLRDFWGFQRAKHAVLEAAILVTRLHLLRREEIEQQFQWHRSAVDKTGGDAEKRALKLLEQFASNYWSQHAN